jgi:alpha-glucosidase
MLPTLNMSGFYYVGADTGGFGGNSSGELLSRWMQLSVFTPLLRNHAALGTNNQEPYAFGEEVARINRKLLGDRYRLIPYLYSELLKRYHHGGLMFTPLSFEFFGQEAQDAEDQLLLGEELMIAPIYKPNGKGRYVYLPEEMALVDFKDQPELTVLNPGVHYVSYDLDELKFFLRRNKMMVYGEASLNEKSMKKDSLNLLGFVDGEATYTLYSDDGLSFEYEEGQVSKTKIQVTKKDNGDYKISVENNHIDLKTITLTLVDANGEIYNKEVRV